ncbi:MAG: hypothetical protein JOZ22_17830 [Acidobacteriia bacterium]|nr:hypothetical protein [Terriglobia bacterium]MBV9745121.1 hypothetical protein [Terriglobia bacterium]
MARKPTRTRTKSTPIEPVSSIKKQPPPETGAAAAGQSGDLQGLPGKEEAGNESVRELIEEGQFYEASVVDAVENVSSDDPRPLRPRRRSEDDLREEYTDRDPDEPKE